MQITLKHFLLFLEQNPPIKMARRYYNSVVDALRLINIGTGYETRPDEEVKEYFKPLRVADE